MILCLGFFRIQTPEMNSILLIDTKNGDKAKRKIENGDKKKNVFSVVERIKT